MTEAPLSISTSKATALMTLQWPDGRVTQLGHARLRAACPCSRCRAARLNAAITVVEEGVTVVAIEPQGYGAQLVFSDGHERGIYPWAYLRELELERLEHGLGRSAALRKNTSSLSSLGLSSNGATLDREGATSTG